MKASELDEIFDNGGDIMEFIDPDSWHRPGHVIHRVDIDLPVWLINSLDSESRRLGITRQELMLQWLTERETLRRAEAESDRAPLA